MLKLKKNKNVVIRGGVLDQGNGAQSSFQKERRSA